MQFLGWLESLDLAVWIRESVSLWAYPGMLSFHTIGLGFVVGISAAFDLRVLGVAREVPLEPMRGFFPVMWIGFWINAISGVALLVAYATSMMTNPIFLIKLVLIVLAVINVRMLVTEVFADPGRAGRGEVSQRARVLAGTSLGLWAGAILTGRFVAYIDLVKGLFFGGEG